MLFAQVSPKLNHSSLLVFFEYELSKLIPSKKLSV